jgi:hypothetical protein
MNENGAALDVVTHDAPAGRVAAAVAQMAALDEVHGTPSALPVISDRGV